VDAVRSSNSFWAAGDHQFLNVRRFADANFPIDIYLYEFAAGGELQSLIKAERAEVRPDGTWLLEGVSRKRYGGTPFDTERLASLVWQSFLRPRQTSLLTLPADSMQPLDLYRYVRDLERRHQPAARYTQELWAKMDIPLAMAAMILIAVPFVFGLLRTQGIGQRNDDWDDDRHDLLAHSADNDLLGSVAQFEPGAHGHGTLDRIDGACVLSFPPGGCIAGAGAAPQLSRCFQKAALHRAPVRRVRR